MTDLNFNTLREYLIGTDTAPGILRKQQVSVEELARLAGLNRAAVYSYLTDRHRPDEEAAHALAKALGVPVAEITSRYTPRKKGRRAGSGGVKQLPVRK